MTILFDTIAPLHQTLDYHVDRHNLISANVANADTPGYRPREMTFAAELGEAGLQMPMARTAEGHLAPNSADGAAGYRVYEETWATPGADGNYVRLEHEMSRMQANGIRYRASTQMITQHMGMLRYAIAGRR